jgi:hypothetical protein
MKCQMLIVIVYCFLLPIQTGLKNLKYQYSVLTQTSQNIQLF